MRPFVEGVLLRFLNKLKYIYLYTKSFMQKKESLSTEIIEKLSTIQNDLTKIVMELGQLSLRKRDLKSELENVDIVEKSVQTTFDDKNKELNSMLAELEKTYPNGEIDLVEGAVYFESPE
jgi:chromosome segregation ATPase